MLYENDDMTLKQLLYEFCVHTAMAAAVFCIALILGEYVMPAFASPFIPVVHLALLILAVCVATTIVTTQQRKKICVWSRMAQGACMAIVLCIGGLLLWAHVDTNSRAELSLLAAYGILSIIFFIATIITV